MNKKIKLLLNEFEFLKVQEKDTEELLSESKKIFTTDVYKYMDENGLERKKESINIPKPKENKDSDTKTTEAPTKYKKLFRKIVSNTHPDKLKKDISDSDRETFKEVYEETVEGYQNDNYVPLILNAIKIGIDVGKEFNEELSMIKSFVEEKRKSIEEMKKTYAWVYHNDLEDIQKEQFIKTYYKNYKSII